MSEISNSSKREKNSLDIFEDLSREQIMDLQNKNISLTAFDPKCIRQKSNWSKASKKYQFDSGAFKPEKLAEVIPEYSPKLDTLLKKIENLDRKDRDEFGHTFKHFIFSDLKSGVYGAKMIASALIADGYHLGYKAELKRPLSEKEQEDDVQKENDENIRQKKIWGPIEMLPIEDLSKTKGDNFYLLSSTSVYDKPISVRMKKEILANFNSRPENNYGEHARIIVMDSGFKEGIDLFDIKYIHIFEPSVNPADQKQVIGRGTRTCGQKGLPFDMRRGWPLHVFIYDLEIPEDLQSSLMSSKTAFDLYMKALNLDVRLLNFTYDIERIAVIGSVDYELNLPVHKFALPETITEESPILSSISKGSLSSMKEITGGKKHIRYDLEGNIRNTMGHDEMRDFIHTYYKQFTWEKVKMENLCPTDTGIITGGSPSILKYTASQDFLRHYFSPQAPVKGLLMNWSVGTGKTAAAIAAASRNFETAGYTILWVTRTTLKNDIWKNMFQQVANESIRDLIANGHEIPKDLADQMKLLGKAWRIRPISYKQFSNLVSKQNDYYHRLVKENGNEDPLRKTLLIIDEAHKLYGGGDLSSIERPDMVALHKALMHSYAVSGENSCRLLLMTATPITEAAIELVQLINLCKMPEDQMPHTFDSFSKEYLNTDGQFTEKGERRFLDDIAGYISYLNREKDARQFAQPVIKRINTPIVSAQNMEIVKKYDKFILKAAAELPLGQIKQRLEENMEKINGELKEMGKERFIGLKTVCDDIELPKKFCNKIVNRNIAACVKEIKEYIKSFKNEANLLRKQIKDANAFKTAELNKIKMRIEENPEEFENYMNSAYVTLRDKCSYRISTVKELKEYFNEHPDVKILDDKIRENEEQIEMSKNKVGVIKDAYRLKLQELKTFLKDDLSDLERSVIQRTIIDIKNAHTKGLKTTRKQVKNRIDDAQEAIKYAEKSKKTIYRTLRKELRNVANVSKKQREKEKREEIKARKLSRKQGVLMDEIKDEVAKGIADKYEEKIDRELMLFAEQLLEEQEEKEREKDDKKIRKEKEREQKIQEKKVEKEREKTRKNKEKMAAKKKSPKKSPNKTKKSKSPKGIAAKIAQMKALVKK